jgi:MGT family glycosyltransferase
VDALVLDAVQLGFPLVAMHLGIPYVHVSSGLHLDYWGHTPLCIFDWPHEEGAAAAARNRQGLEMFRRATAAITAIQRDFAERVGLQLDWDDLSRTISRRGWLTQTPKEFDFPSDHWPDYLHHVGPLHDSHSRAPVTFPWERLSHEPLIYASMGTLQNGAEDVFRTIVAGAQAPGRQIVLSVGSHLSPDQIGTVAANTVVVNRAPQIELLKRSALCITHAGLNTALESLAQGVPMVAIPVANDQPGVAARIAHTKTGIVIPLKELNAERVRDAVEEVMTNPSYRENARHLQASIQKTNGLDVAADLIERTFQHNGSTG